LKGLSITVHPLSKKEIDEIFMIDLLDKGVLPILIIADNRNASTSFILSKKKVAVVDQKAIKTININRTKVVSDTAGEVMSEGVSAILPLPLIVAGAKMTSDAQVIQHNLGVKELQSRTLDPNQSAHGYVYFQFPKSGVEKLNNFHVLIEAIDTFDFQLISFDIPFNYSAQ
ncbi:MAG: hypothetical protein ACU84J_14245, partial [Gammaproteobacteria bacterium]